MKNKPLSHEHLPKFQRARNTMQACFDRPEIVVIHPNQNQNSGLISKIMVGCAFVVALVAVTTLCMKAMNQSTDAMQLINELTADYQAQIQDAQQKKAYFEKAITSAEQFIDVVEKKQARVDSSYRSATYEKIRSDIARYMRSIPSVLNRREIDQLLAEVESSRDYSVQHKAALGEVENDCFGTFFDAYESYVSIVTSNLHDELDIDRSVSKFRSVIKSLKQIKGDNTCISRTMAYCHFAIANLYLRNVGRNWEEAAISELIVAVGLDSRTAKYKVNLALAKVRLCKYSGSNADRLEIVNSNLELLAEAMQLAYRTDRNFALDTNSRAELLLQKAEFSDDASMKQVCINDAALMLFEINELSRAVPAVKVTLAEALAMKLDLENTSLTPNAKRNLTTKIIESLRAAISAGFDLQANDSSQLENNFPRFAQSNDPTFIDSIWKSITLNPSDMDYWDYDCSD